MRELVESINHHLRTPLSSILGHADLLLDHRHELPGHVQDSLAGLMRAGLRLDDVVTSVCDLLEVAFACPANVEQINISQMLAQELQAHQNAVVMRGVELYLEGEPDVVCAADSVSLRRAIRALLENATSRSPRQSVVRAAAVRTHGGVQITVQDDVSRCVTPADDGGDAHVVEEHAEVGLIHSELRLDGGGRETDLATDDHGTRRLAPADQLFLDGVRGVCVVAPDQVPHGTARNPLLSRPFHRLAASATPPR